MGPVDGGIDGDFLAGNGCRFGIFMPVSVA
jgi:hypothetical protein